MAESIPLAELELRIALLPPVSRGAHLGGPMLHAQRLVDLWKIEADDDIPLEQAFRLLDAEAVAGAIIRTGLARDAGIEAWTVKNLAKLWGDGDDVDLVKDHPPVDSSYWTFPDLSDLLLELQALCWQTLLDGEFQIEAIPYERSKVGLAMAARPVPLVDLPRLSPDWKLSRLCRADRDEWVNARVCRTPVESLDELPDELPDELLPTELLPAELLPAERPSGLLPVELPDELPLEELLPVETPTEPPKRQRWPQAKLKATMEEIEQGHPKDAPPPPFSEIEAVLETRLPGITQAQKREALKYAPRLRGERGRPRKPPA